jgi:metal-sulfur cluster biosynthetic enzyme
VTLQAQALAALATVYDPELDEPITTLGFVSSCSVSDGADVDVRLRLPTPQCAPNFAFLMASDAREAVRAVPGVRAVGVVLDDHYTGDEINAAVGRGGTFDDAFPGESEASLDALRELFQRKALVGRQSRVCRSWLADGLAPQDIVDRSITDLPGGLDAERCVGLRAALGLSTHPDAPALVAGDGTRLPAEGLDRWLRRASLISLSLESNGGLCRSLLKVRYGVPDGTQEEVAA